MTGEGWQLSREALDRLLEALGPNREEASLRYEALRARLIDLFTWEADPDPEHLADVTLNRLARRVLEGEEVRNLNHYALGIARMVNLEAGRARQKQKSAVREMQSSAAGASAEAPGMDAMDGCLKGLAPQSRELIERYYAGDRARLAQSLGISVNTLRNRALRIRQRLFECMQGRRDVSGGFGHHE